MVQQSALQDGMSPLRELPYRIHGVYTIFHRVICPVVSSTLVNLLTICLRVCFTFLLYYKHKQAVLLLIY